MLRQKTAALAQRGHDVSVLTTDAAGAGRRCTLGGPGQPVFDPPVRIDVYRAQRAHLATFALAMRSRAGGPQRTSTSRCLSICDVDAEVRIVHIITGIAAESGGPTEVLRQMTAELAQRGHELTVLTTDAAGKGRRYELGAAGQPVFDPAVQIRVFPVLSPWPPYPSPGHARASWNATGFDVAHVHGLFALPVSLAMAAFRRRGLPYVLRPCGMLDGYSLRQRERLKRGWMAVLDRPNLLGAAHIQVSTEHEAEAVRALLAERLHGRIVVLPQGVSAQPRPSGRRVHARPYLLFLSRLARKKGLIALVEAFAIVARARLGLDLVLAGPDEAGHRAEVEAKVRALGLSDRVLFKGTVSGADKSDLFAGCEAFVLPSGRRELRGRGDRGGPPRCAGHRIRRCRPGAGGAAARCGSGDDARPGGPRAGDAWTR